MKTLLFTCGLIAGITIAIGLDYFRLKESKAISSVNFRLFIQYRDSANGLKIKLDSLRNYDNHIGVIVNEIKHSGHIHQVPDGGCVGIER